MKNFIDIMESKMDKYIINGGKKLCGSLQIKGAKNSVLPLLAGSILTKEKVVLLNCPDITDVRNMLGILENLGCKTEFLNGRITVDSANLNNSTICSELAKELRSSIFLLGALLSRVGKAEVSYPGGCDIGLRPINLHINGLKALGVEISEEKDFLNCQFVNPKACKFVLELPSVGATENIIMASVFIKGVTIVENCAKEPEIVDLQNFLNLMGAKICGAGTKTIFIEGVKSLHGVEYTPISDRIVAGTYLIAGAMCGGEICLCNATAMHNVSLLNKLSKTS
ncbi:MAG: UDP-N-acetylglucosamine 1-carboxyvinyltransferase, partial [Clostridia bacterium]